MKVANYIFTFVLATSAAIAFGYWMQSVFAFAFMWNFLIYYVYVHGVSE